MSAFRQSLAIAFACTAGSLCAQSVVAENTELQKAQNLKSCGSELSLKEAQTLYAKKAEYFTDTHPDQRLLLDVIRCQRRHEQLAAQGLVPDPSSNKKAGPTSATSTKLKAAGTILLAAKFGAEPHPRLDSWKVWVATGSTLAQASQNLSIQQGGNPGSSGLRIAGFHDHDFVQCEKEGWWVRIYGNGKDRSRFVTHYAIGCSDSGQSRDELLVAALKRFVDEGGYIDVFTDVMFGYNDGSPFTANDILEANSGKNLCHWRPVHNRDDIPALQDNHGGRCGKTPELRW